MVAPPSTIDTQFVFYTSYRLPHKTSGKIGHHDMCKLVKWSSAKNVYAPYLIINSLERLITPPADAPSYAFDVPPIYQDLFRLLPEEFEIESISPSEPRQMPMCNSFLCSLETYALFHPFVLKKIILQYNEVEDYSAAYKQLEKDGYNVAVVQGLELALMVKGSEIGFH